MIDVSKDLAPARQARLRDLVRREGSVRVEDICRQLKTSPATVRRDLEALEQQGLIKRVHGGAVSVESNLVEHLFDDKRGIASSEKNRIADYAATLINEGDTVFLDGGSTVLELARRLVDRTDVTVVTNSLRAAAELSGRGPSLILVGGELRRISQTLVGSLTSPILEQIHVDIAFMGTMGISLDAGLTTSDANEAFTKKLAMSRARRVVLLSDSSKAGKTSFAKAGEVGRIDVLVTDDQLSPRFKDQLEKQSVNVITL